LLGLAFLFVSLLSAVVVISPAVRTGDWRSSAARFNLLLVIPCWVLSVIWVRRQAARHLPRRDPYLLPVMYLLTGWGMLTIGRVAPGFGARQLVWFLVGSLLLGGMLARSGILEALRRYRILWLLCGLLLTALTLFFGTHPSGGEQRLWLRILGIYIQPSEPLRLLLVVYLASYFSETLPFRETHQGAWIPTLTPLLAMWGLSVGLLLVQRDLGTATLVLAILAGLLYFASGRRIVFVGALLFTALAGGTGYLLSDVVQVRVDAWLNPWADPIGGGYQMIQSLIGIASGGLLGQGPGLGSPGFIPAVHTDFIFAAVIEETGAVGGIAMLALFALLIERGLRITLHQRSSYRVLLGAGLTISLGFQALYILGGVLRLLPLAGITLPFVSYGGSSLVSSFLLMGLLLLLSDQLVDNSAYERPVRDLSLLFLASWSGLAIILGWWTVYRAPVLVARTDNPRRALESRYSLRGSILDRDGDILAESTGMRGEYERSYPLDATSVVVGYDSMLFGKSGIEQSLDDVLRGAALRDAWEVWWAYKLYAVPPEGLDVRLTIDADIQNSAVDTLGNRPAAAVVLEAQSGDILALASSPAFSASTLEEDWEQLVLQPESPLINRATQAAYQPGMVLAPFSYIWALQEGVIQVEETPDAPDAVVRVDGTALSCTLTPGMESDITYGEAMLAGCPAALLEIGEELDEAGMMAMLAAFGFNRLPALELPQVELDLPGSVEPADEAIGQGAVQISPLQLARAWSAVVDGGVLPGIRLVDALQSPEGEWLLQSSRDAERTILEADLAAQIPELFPEVGGGVRGYAASAISGESGETVAWFMGFNRHEPPRIVVIVLEDGTPAEARVLGVELLGGLDAIIP